MQGILLVDKPATWTSFDVVNYIRRQVAESVGKRPKEIKVGHAGTLDPFAAGLLVILIGKNYTKRAAEFSKLDKTYAVTMKLGVTSSTGDPEGEITPVSDTIPTLENIREVAKAFTGTLDQTPPIYSAIKVGGQRAYKLARAGKEVKLEPRKVIIHQLKVVSYKYPELKLVAEVSSGTYIRSLVQDIGTALGTGAYTSELRRLSIGSFDATEAIPPQQFDSGVSLQR